MFSRARSSNRLSTVQPIRGGAKKIKEKINNLRKNEILSNSKLKIYVRFPMHSFLEITISFRLMEAISVVVSATANGYSNCWLGKFIATSDSARLILSDYSNKN